MTDDERTDLGGDVSAYWDEYGYLHIQEEFGHGIELSALQALRLMQYIERCGTAQFRKKHGDRL